MKRLSVKKLVACLGATPDQWISQCHIIATAAIQAGCYDGEARYGSYFGPVSKRCPFEDFIIKKQQNVPIRHGWIEQDDGTIIDPTRWVFLGIKPVIFSIRPTDPEYQEYDAGSQVLRTLIRTPPPTRESDPRLCPKFIPSDALLAWVKVTLQDTQGYPFTLRQLGWLANIPPHQINIKAILQELYQQLEVAGLKAFIPVDYWDIVFKKNSPQKSSRYFY